MPNPYDVGALIKRIKLRAFTSTSGSLSDQEVVDLANDSLDQYIVAKLKENRDEWFVAETDLTVMVTDNVITIPSSVGSTVRTIAWNNGGIWVPLTRVEPENAFGYQPNGSTIPVGYMLKGYSIVLLPPQVGQVQIQIARMIRPPTMVLPENAGESTSHTGAAFTLISVPLEWQSAAPTKVDIINPVDPFSIIIKDAAVTSLVGKVLTLAEDPGVVGDVYFSDPGTSPFPNIPIEFHPLLAQDVVCTLMRGLGDKRLAAQEKSQDTMEKNLKAISVVRTQGSSRPLVNPNKAGMRGFGGWMGRGWGSTGP